MPVHTIKITAVLYYAKQYLDMIFIYRNTKWACKILIMYIYRYSKITDWRKNTIIKVVNREIKYCWFWTKIVLIKIIFQFWQKGRIKALPTKTWHSWSAWYIEKKEGQCGHTIYIGHNFYGDKLSTLDTRFCCHF